jgi:hypothetical protein
MVCGTLYDRDFYSWTQDQAARLREAGALRLNAGLDWGHLAEEIESMGRSDRREIRSRLEILLLHLLKLAWSPDEPPRAGWRETVTEQRRRLQLVLEDSPSLRGFPAESLAACWQAACEDCEQALGLAIPTAGDGCPWEVDREILANGWFPGPHRPVTGE